MSSSERLGIQTRNGEALKIAQKLSEAETICDLVDILQKCGDQWRIARSNGVYNIDNDWHLVKHATLVKAIMRRAGGIKGISVSRCFKIGRSIPPEHRESLIFVFETFTNSYVNAVSVQNLERFFSRDRLTLLLEPFDPFPEINLYGRKFFYLSSGPSRVRLST